MRIMWTRWEKRGEKRGEKRDNRYVLVIKKLCTTIYGTRNNKSTNIGFNYFYKCQFLIKPCHNPWKGCGL